MCDWVTKTAFKHSHTFIDGNRKNHDGEFIIGKYYTMNTETFCNNFCFSLLFLNFEIFNYVCT